MEWIEEYKKLFFAGKKDEAYELKYNNFPKKLYKYEVINREKINMLINSELWFSNPDDFNDPFDSCGICFDEGEIKKYLKDTDVSKLINSFKKDVKICCFSEEINSMPMWTHYAGNHEGMCAEYDFSKVSYTNRFSKYLFPIVYQTERYDITNILKDLINDKTEDAAYMLFFMMQIKHISWNYEKEWRIILKDKQIRKNVKFPIKPSALYLGLNCSSKNVELIKKLAHNSINCPIYKLEKTNTKLFNFKSICIDK
ncbi:DUF2971 domain-containing protein [Clostridium guangxiense]|uniref:DUF2971 domain-containing protein n=1 Tax=Clostridium guangxiense TaxID=1662055 RepID=UPI001E5CF8DD|nr:DUF2971 domain-containing protein [Clostridium guangxiense]MCD2346668.1 DUF2971 domain-containing protein [Clostridium guangxiense]